MKAETAYQRKVKRLEMIMSQRIERASLFTDEIHKQVELEMCASDPVHFINNWMWTYDPRNVSNNLPTKIPLVLYPQQARLVEWLHERTNSQDNGLIEKSRDEGATWVICAGYLVHQMLFNRGFSAGVGSRKQELVDRLGDMNAIFPKIRFAISHLPKWMQPSRPAYTDDFCRIINRDMDTAITGEAGDEIGRGGRVSLYVVDEAAFVAHPDQVDRALLGMGSPICWLSTPNGNANPFAMRRKSGDVPVFTLHWRDNPFKDAEWERKTRASMSEAEFAQEHDIDYAASIERQVIPAKWVNAAVNLVLTPTTDQMVAGLDIADGGKDENVLTFRRGAHMIDQLAWHGDGNPNNTAHRAITECQQRGVKVLHYDRVGVGASVSGPLQAHPRLGFRYISVLGGAKPSVRHYSDAPDRQASDRFHNLRAEIHWALRIRFMKTYEYVHDGVDHPHNELITIPADAELISQLSQSTYSYTDAGKIKIDSKEYMRSHGLKSPDRADSAVYAYISDTSSIGVTAFGPKRRMAVG